MSKETLLRKAYNAATVNEVTRVAEGEVRFDIIRNSMVDYAKKNHMTLDHSDIEKYIDTKLAELSEATKDFNYQSKMMN